MAPQSGGAGGGSPLINTQVPEGVTLQGSGGGCRQMKYFKRNTLNEVLHLTYIICRPGKKGSR